MAQLLENLVITIAGHARPLYMAGRFYADLGATVLADPPEWMGAADRLWLDNFSPRPATSTPTSLLLAERGYPLGGSSAEAVVRYAATSSRAAAQETLDERELTAVGGMAIAIGEPGRPALPLPDGCLDSMVGAHVAAAGLAALVLGERTTEVAAADVVAWAVATNLHLYVPYGLPWMRAGRRASGSGSCYPYGLFEAADGLFCMIGRTDGDWRALQAAMGNPAWARAPRFSDPRVLGRLYPEEADPHLGDWTRRHRRDQLTDVVAKHSFPGAPVLEPSEVLEQPSLTDRWWQRRLGRDAIRVPGAPFDAITRAARSSGRELAELLVLDLSWVWSGPAVSVALADLGATVVKVESSRRPDNSRLRGRPAVGGEEGPAEEMAPYFHALNRGKHSIALDLKTEAGRELLQRLAAQADVIVENLSPGVMERFGVAPEAVHATNPGCVFLSMRGYRPHPSTAGLRAYAPALSSSAGIEALVSYPGEPALGAMTVAFSDALATSHGLLLALAGLWSRHEHQQGSAITLSQAEGAVLANGHNLVAAQLGGVRQNLQQFEAGDDMVAGAQSLPRSPWLSTDLLTEVHPRWAGPVQVARLPWRIREELPVAKAPGPVLGSDTDRVLSRRLGLSANELATLHEAGVLS